MLIKFISSVKYFIYNFNSNHKSNNNKWDSSPSPSLPSLWYQLMPPLSITKLTLRTWLEIQNIDNLLKSQKSNIRDLNLLNKNQSKEFNKKPREVHITDQSKKSQLSLKEVMELGNKRPKTLPRKLVKPFKMLTGIMFNKKPTMLWMPFKDKLSQLPMSQPQKKLPQKKKPLLKKRLLKKRKLKKKKLPKKKLPKRKLDQCLFY